MSNIIIEEMMGNVVASEELKRKIAENTCDKVKVVKLKKHNVKRIILVASLCMMLFGTMTALAANYSEKIANYLARFFGFDDKTMKELVDEGYVENISESASEGVVTSVTKEGITVSVKQTIADGNTIRMLINVKSNNGYELSDDFGFQEINVKSIGSTGSRVSMIEAENSTPDELWFSLEIDNGGAGEGFKEGDVILVDLKNFMLSELVESERCKLDKNNNVVLNGEEYHIQLMDINDFEVLEKVAEMSTFSFLYDDKGNGYYIASVDGNEIPSGDVELTVDENGDKYVILKYLKEQVVVEKTWQLRWELTVNEDYVEVPVNDIIDANGYRYYIDDVKIRGFALDVNFAENAEIIDESYVLANSEIHIYDQMMMKYAKLMEEQDIIIPYSYMPDYCPLDIKLVMRNGREYKMSDVHKAGWGKCGEWYQLDEKIDLENIDKVIIEGREYILK